MSAYPWSEWVIRGAFALTALIHLLPLAGEVMWVDGVASLLLAVTLLLHIKPSLDT